MLKTTLLTVASVENQDEDTTRLTSGQKFAWTSEDI